MIIESIKDTQRLLRNWGQWSRVRIGTEYLPVHPMWRDAVSWQDRSYEGLFNDEAAMTIDAAIGQLQHFDDLGHRLVVGYYRNSMTLRKLAQAHGSSVSALRQVLRGAEGYLSGAVAGRLMQVA